MLCCGCMYYEELLYNSSCTDIQEESQDYRLMNFACDLNGAYLQRFDLLGWNQG